MDNLMETSAAGAETSAAAETRYERAIAHAQSLGQPTWERTLVPELQVPSMSAYHAMIHTYAAAGDLRCLFLWSRVQCSWPEMMRLWLGDQCSWLRV